MKERATRVALLLLCVVTIAVFADNSDRPLANPDEGRYSEISREMAATGDWVTPRLNGVKYFEKPPLQYWASAAIFRTFGESEVAARLYTTLCGILTILAIGFTARRLWDEETGLASMLALASAPYFMGMAGIVTLDVGLTLWTTLTFCAFLLAEHASGDARNHRGWMLVAWAAMALAVLSKGLIGLVFPAAALGMQMALRRDFSPLARLEWLRGGAIFLAISVPWFAAVSAANEEFFRFFFVHEHFERFLTTTHRRTGAWYYFILILLAGFLPWLVAFPFALARAIRDEFRSEGLRPLTFALLWGLFIVAFFSASGSKLPPYILPAFPPLALLLGRFLVEARPRNLAIMLIPAGILSLVLVALAWRLPSFASNDWSRQLYTSGKQWAVLGALALAVSAAAGTILLFRGRRMLALVVVALGSVLSVSALEDFYEVLSPRQSGLVVADKMRPWLAPATRIYSVSHYDQTVPFYIGRTVTLVDYVDEFETGLRSEPGKAIANLADFPAEWQRPGEALAIMQPDLLEKFRAQGLPMQVLHQDPRRVLVRKP